MSVPYPTEFGFIAALLASGQSSFLSGAHLFARRNTDEGGVEVHTHDDQEGVTKQLPRNAQAARMLILFL